MKDTQSAIIADTTVSQDTAIWWKTWESSS